MHWCQCAVPFLIRIWLAACDYKLHLLAHGAATLQASLQPRAMQGGECSVLPSVQQFVGTFQSGILLPETAHHCLRPALRADAQQKLASGCLAAHRPFCATATSDTTSILHHPATKTTIHVVGTSHISEESAQQVRDTISKCGAACYLLRPRALLAAAICNAIKSCVPFQTCCLQCAICDVLARGTMPPRWLLWLQTAVQQLMQQAAMPLPYF